MNISSDLIHPVQIGSLVLPGNLFLAPVAGYSDRAFRSLCVEYGASFTYTEMVSAEALVRNSEKTETLLLRAENEDRYAVQIFGGEAERVAQAAQLVFEKTQAECIDINAGCPVPKICKTGAGASLTRDPQRLYEIVTATIQRLFDSFKTPPPVTVKIRSGWDESRYSWKEAASAALDAGAKAITIHPRTRAQGYEGLSRWEILAELVSYVRTNYLGIPVFGSGDLFSPESVQKMFIETDCDAIMFARGAMGNPFIFKQTIELLQLGEYQEIPAHKRICAGWKELLQLTNDVGELVACREMRKRFSAYSKGIEKGASLRSDLVKASSVEEYLQIFKNFGFKCE